MERNTLVSWLWRAASSLRGEVDATRYKDYILPLIFYKRIDDVFGDELERVRQALRDQAKVAARLGKAVEEPAPSDIRHPVQFYGQELQADNVAAVKMNAFIHGLDADIRHTAVASPATPLRTSATKTDRIRCRLARLCAGPCFTNSSPGRCACWRARMLFVKTREIQTRRNNLI